MQISEQTRAVLLLTAWFGKAGAGAPRPLTTGEWGRFAAWLHACGQTPAQFVADPARLGEWDDPQVPAGRIEHLLERSAALAMSVERWQRAGLWIISRSDAAWPKRLRARSGLTAPPVLFGAGSQALLQAGGVAVVGARDVSDAELAFTRRLGAEVAHQAANLVSGGARGVDEAAMLGALAAEGTAVGVLADSLLRAGTSMKFRQHLMDGNLALVSPFNPEARFSVANAMSRNRYVYCLSDAAVVIASARDKGGTWAGATENLKHGWVPLWVKPESAHPGNAALLRKGALSLPPLDRLDVPALTSAPLADQQPGFPAELSRVGEPAPHFELDGQPDTLLQGDAPEPQDQTQAPAATRVETEPYPDFLDRLRNETSDGPLTPAELQEKLQIGKHQLAHWLKQAVDQGEAEKLTRPVRYRIATARQQSLGL